MTRKWSYHINVACNAFLKSLFCDFSLFVFFDSFNVDKLKNSSLFFKIECLRTLRPHPFSRKKGMRTLGETIANPLTLEGLDHPVFDLRWFSHQVAGFTSFALQSGGFSIPHSPIGSLFQFLFSDVSFV